VKEKRRWPRAKVMAEIQWSRDEDASPGLTEKTKNIGAGGVCLVSKEKLNSGDRLRLEINLPTGDTIRAKARVVWTKKYEITVSKTNEIGYYTGVEFIDILEEDRAKIEQVVFNYNRDIKARH